MRIELTRNIATDIKQAIKSNRQPINDGLIESAQRTIFELNNALNEAKPYVIKPKPPQKTSQNPPQIKESETHSQPSNTQSLEISETQGSSPLKENYSSDKAPEEEASETNGPLGFTPPPPGSEPPTQKGRNAEGASHAQEEYNLCYE